MDSLFQGGVKFSTGGIVRELQICNLKPIWCNSKTNG